MGTGVKLHDYKQVIDKKREHVLVMHPDSPDILKTKDASDKKRTLAQRRKEEISIPQMKNSTVTLGNHSSHTNKMVGTPLSTTTQQPRITM